MAPTELCAVLDDGGLPSLAAGGRAAVFALLVDSCRRVRDVVTWARTPLVPLFALRRLADVRGALTDVAVVESALRTGFGSARRGFEILAGGSGEATAETTPGTTATAAAAAAAAAATAGVTLREFSERCAAAVSADSAAAAAALRLPAHVLALLQRAAADDASLVTWPDMARVFALAL